METSDGLVKWKKVHLSAEECYKLGNSVDGFVSISKPLQFQSVLTHKFQSRFPNREASLQPKPSRKVKRMSVKMSSVTHGEDDSIKLSSQPQVGFIKASAILSAPVARNNNKSPNAKAPIPQLNSQGSIMKFMTVRKPTSKEEVTKHGDSVNSNTAAGLETYQKSEVVNMVASQCSPHRKSSKMFSPIKQFSPDSRCIYVSDDSPSSSQKSSQGSVKAENSTVKRLFDAQKELNQNQPNNKKRQKTEKKQRHLKLKNDLSTYIEISDNSCSSFSNENSEDESKHGSYAPSGVSDRYGLLGTGRSSQLLNESCLTSASTCNYFDRLPLEVVENIFCMLPMLDLCLNSNRVCTSWSKIISADKVCLYNTKSI